MIIIKNLIDDAKCYQTIRDIRWKDGNIICPKCDSTNVIKYGFDEIQKERQKYHCKECGVYFDDLTDTIFSGHHQPLKVWILCLYFMGLNLSNNQISEELDLNKDVVQGMTSQLREGIVKKSL